MKKIVLIAASFALFACNNDSSTSTNNSGESPFVAGGAYSQELSDELKEFEEQEAKEWEEKKARLTDVEFLQTTFDFGDVKVNSENVHYFKLKNTGDKPLIVEKIQASCGCTTPQKLENPIAPGQIDSIRVQFVPYEGMHGTQEKTVTVTTNTFIATNKIIFTANVIE